MAVCSYQKGKENPLIAYKAFKGHTANMVSANENAERLNEAAADKKASPDQRAGRGLSGWLPADARLRSRRRLGLCRGFLALAPARL
jgi:hypothetical protein